MYGPNVTILLMYESHDTRHTGFCRLTVVNGTSGNGASQAKRVLGLNMVTIIFNSSFRPLIKVEILNSSVNPLILLDGTSNLV